MPPKGQVTSTTGQAKLFTMELTIPKERAMIGRQAKELEIDKSTRADLLNVIFERMDRLEKMGIIGQDGDILINVSEAATLACVEYNTVLGWAQDGDISRYKLGGAVRFGLREFSKWIASCHEPAIREKKPVGKKRGRPSKKAREGSTLA